jgi:uncharacterized membrane protein
LIGHKILWAIGIDVPGHQGFANPTAVHGGRRHFCPERQRMLIPVPETHGRSIAKAVSWRITGSIDTFALSWFVTGSVVSASSIASAEVVTRIVLYYFHERAWALLPFERQMTFRAE